MTALQELMEIALAIGYPENWNTNQYPTLLSAIQQLHFESINE